MGKIAVITSGKGGVGKSTVTAGLGCALAARDQKVLLIDGDAGLRTLDVMLGVTAETVHDLADVLDNTCDPSAALYASPLGEGLFVLPAPSSLERLASPEGMRWLCRGFARYFDHILIDCPAGIGAGFRAAAAAADVAYIVCTPDAVCTRDARITGTLLEEMGIPARLVINRLRAGYVQRSRAPDIDAVMDMAALPLAGVLPEDEDITLACAAGETFPTDSLAGLCLTNLAARHMGEQVPLMRLDKPVKPRR